MDAYDLARMSWQIFVTIEGHDCWVLIVVVDVGKRNCPALDDWLNFSDFNELIKWTSLLLIILYHVLYLHWVDSFKRWNNVGNLTLLSNVRFLTSFRRLEESTHYVSTKWKKKSAFPAENFKNSLMCRKVF